jgi:oligoribonuclease (3'-5' exoribonuclease)
MGIAHHCVSTTARLRLVIESIRIQELSTDAALDICYLFKYVEKSKQSCRKNPWSIRQTGVYHKYNEHTKQSLWIVLSPTSDSAAQQRIVEYVQNASNRRKLIANSILLHTLLLSSYISNWRDYCEYHEIEIEHIVSLSNRIHVLDALN